MKNNSNINDIFASDSGKNKTKTILLLSVVAIILIVIFLIVAWVMTRDNSIHSMSKHEAQEELDKMLINPEERRLEYAYNEELDSNKRHNQHNQQNQNNQNNKLGLDLSQNSLSTNPPSSVGSSDSFSSTSLGANSNNAPINDSGGNNSGIGNTGSSNSGGTSNTGATGGGTDVFSAGNTGATGGMGGSGVGSTDGGDFIPTPLPSKSKSNLDSYENDPQYQQNLKKLEDKNKMANSTANTAGVNTSTVSLGANSSSNSVANSTPSSLLVDSKNAKNSKDNVKDSVNVKATQKVVTPPPPKEVGLKDKNNAKNNKGQMISPNDSKNAKKDSKDAKDSKLTQNQNLAQIQKASDKSDKIIQRPQSNNKNNGASASKGHYVQVGSFLADKKDLDPLFIKKIQEYGYRVQSFEKDGKQWIRYLIGPYQNQQESKNKLQEIKTKFSDAIYKEVK